MRSPVLLGCWGFHLNLCVGGLFAPISIFMPGFDPRGS